MSKEQKDLEIMANELGKELDDEEIEAVAGGAPVYECQRNGDDTNYYDPNKDSDDSHAPSCGGIATGFNPNPGPVRNCTLCIKSGTGHIIG
jgi:hypothetical protein